ncbi:MAG: hypothetical protein HOV81_07655 [Kofleriaceae bacterium]|nr:hypothetical protein [Kofleriaceae bacterium]
MLLVIGSAFAYLRVEWEGADLGDNIASILNKRMRGRIAIGGVEWDTRSLKTVVTGGWAKVVITNVKVWDDCALSSELDPLDERRLGDPNEDCTLDDRPDPDPSSKRKPRKLLLDAPRVEAEIDVHAALFGNHDLVFRNVWVYGGEALLEQTSEPYPLHAYDRTIVSFLTAFYPRMKAGFRAGIYADSPPPKFDLRDFHVKDLNLTVQFAPYPGKNGAVGYGLAARIEGVDVDATPVVDEKSGVDDQASYLHMNAMDPLVPKFYVRLALKGKHAYVRVLDEGPRGAFVLPGQRMNTAWNADRKALYELELSEIVVNRLAQLPDQWGKKDYVANNLELDVQMHTLPCKTSGAPAPTAKDGADVHLTGSLLEWWDRPYDGKWDLALAVKNLGPTLRTCIKSTMGGENLNGTIKLSGPFIANPKVSLDLEGLDFDVALAQDKEPLRLTLAEVHGDIDLVNEQGSIDRTKALVRGGKEPGEVMVGATFQLKPWRVRASVDITKPIDIGRFLPPKAATAAGRFLAGKLTAEGDSELGFELKDFDLALGRTETEVHTGGSIHVHKGRLFTDDDFEEIHFQKVAIDAGRNHATFEGWVNTKTTQIRLDGRGCFLDLGIWLDRFELPHFADSACSGASTSPEQANANGPGGGNVILARAGPRQARSGKSSQGGGTGGGSGSTFTITGSYKSPTVTVQTSLAGVPCMDKLSVNATYTADTGVATIHSISSGGLGGIISGSGRLTIPKEGQARVEKLHIEGRRLDSSRLCGLAGTLKGTIDTLEVDVKPTTIQKTREPLDWLQYFSVYAAAKRVTFEGENYSNATVCLNRSDDNRCRPAWAASRLDADARKQCEEGKKGGACAVVSADRELGGRFAATIAEVPPIKSGRATIARHLGGTVALDDLPLAVLDPLIGKGKVGGLVSATIHLGGDRDAPTVEGGSTINLTRSWVAGAYIGDTQLEVIPSSFKNVQGVRVVGTAMAGQLAVDGTLGTAKPFPVDVTLKGRRIEVDHFVNLGEKLGISEPVQAWATGTVTVSTELAPEKPREPELWVDLAEVEATIGHRSREGRAMPIRVALVQAPNVPTVLSLRVTPTTAELACRDYKVASGRRPCPAFLDTPAGVIKVSGTAKAGQMDLVAQSWNLATSSVGTLDLGRLTPLLENQVEAIAGNLELNASVKGTFDKPRYEASLDVVENGTISVRLPGGDSVLQVLGPRIVEGEKLPGAQIKIANGNVGLSSFTVTVKDESKDEQGELNVSGSIALAGLKPASWGVKVEGKIAGKMLSAIAPSAIARATGLARLEGTLFGKGTLPLVDAQLTFDPEEGERARPLTLSPRGIRRELAMSAGTIDVTTKESGPHRTYEIDFRDNPLSMTIDSEGNLSDIRGRIVLTDGKLDFADLGLDAENVPYRVPGEFDVILSAQNIQLSLPGPDAAWRARGNIVVVNGTYRKNIYLSDLVFRAAAPPAAAPSKPIWDEYPSIGNADLELSINIHRFSVQNNIANPIDLTGPRLLLRGSPRDPRLSGSIRVDRGDFKVPGTRPRFTRTTGTIDFVENEKASNPSLAITTDAPDYTDPTGVTHTITATITGTLEQPQVDLRTSTGYNKAQTINLLFFGQTPEQLRRSLGDETTLGTDPTRGDISTNPSGGIGDQLLKDLAGDFLSQQFGATLTRLSGLDVLRFEIGFGSVGLKAEKKAFENVKVLGDLEQTVRGNTLNIRAEVKTPIHVPWKIISDDRLSLEGGYLDKNYYDPAEPDIQDVQGKLVYRLVIP